MLYKINANPSVASMFMNDLRDIGTQKNKYQFRNTLQLLGFIEGYEISRNLNFIPCQIQTPLGVAPSVMVQNPIVLACVLRAGLPFLEGMMDCFQGADISFVGAMRQPHMAGEEIHVEAGYVASSDLTGKTLIICDPMLASGKSLQKAYELLTHKSKPKQIIFACALGSSDGVKYIQETFPNIDLYIFEIDPTLNNMSYIVPGLGDAGDLAFGYKL